MAKATKKKAKTKYNDDAIAELIARYGFSKNYIQKSLRGERTGKMSEILVREYHKLDQASKKAIQEKAEDLGTPETTQV